MALKALAPSRNRANYINDIDKLIAVTKLLAKNPEMKRTTAIKAVGISDPKTIRRLRTKLSQNQKSKDLEVSKFVRDDEVLDRQIAALKTIAKNNSRKRTFIKKASQETKNTSTETQTIERKQAEQTNVEKPDILSCLFSANLAAGQAMIQMQFKMMSYAFQASPLACYLRNQELIRLTLQNLKTP